MPKHYDQDSMAPMHQEMEPPKKAPKKGKKRAGKKAGGAGGKVKMPYGEHCK